MKNSTCIKPYKNFRSIIFTIVAFFFVAAPPPAFAQPVPFQQLRTNLYEVAASTNLLDATITQYSSTGNNAVDRNDAIKIVSITSGTRLGMLRDGKNLVIERRQSITVSDTIFYNLITASKGNYRFEFISVKFDVSVLRGFLEDSYLKTFTPVQLNDTTTVDFTVNADAASSDPNRFRFVFSTELPFALNVSANQAYKDVVVEWTTENEEHIKSYDVETSEDGLLFLNAATMPAKRTTSETYQWLDAHVKKGVYFYRIRSVNDKDEVLYSSIVKVEVDKNKLNIGVYPNPVSNGKINIKFIDQPVGNYELTLMDNFGYVVITKEVYLSHSNVTETMNVGKTMVKGTYRLEILSPDNNITNINVSFQ